MATHLSARRIELESRQMVSAVDLSRNADALLIGQYASDGPPVLSILDAATGQRRAVLDASRYRNVEAARFLGTSGTVAYVTGEPGLELIDVAAEGAHRVALPDRRPASLSVTPSGSRVATGGTHVGLVEGTRLAWSVPAPAPRPMGEPARVAIAHDGRVAAIGLEDGCVAVLGAATGEVLERLAPAPSFARWAQFSHDGNRLVLIEGYAHGAFGWDLTSGSRWLPHLLNEESTSYWCGAFHPDGHRLYLGTNSGFVELIDLSDGRIAWTERVSDGRLWDMSASAGWLAYGGDEGAWISAIG